MPRAFVAVVLSVLLTTAGSFAAGASAADPPRPKKFPGNEPTTIRPAADGGLVLPASKCEVYGKTLQYMPEDRALGWWNSGDDHAVWSLAGVRPGKYEVWFEWSCADESAGNKFLLEAGGGKLRGTIPSTKSWQKHEKAKFGQVELPAAECRLTIRAEGPIKEALADLREVRLTPIGAGQK